jgi:hypothetical protein
MLKSIDILLGLSVVMLLVSLVVTVFTQAVTNLMQTRGRNLRDGISGLLRQIHREIPLEVSRKIAEAILTHPQIKSAGSRYGTVIHREELTALILELAADDGANRLDPSLRTYLCQLLGENGIADPVKTMDKVRTLTLVLESAHPELSNNERYAMAFLQEASSRFLAKMNGWFDQTIDRVADRFTNSTRLITFVGSLLVALILQLDTVTLVNRLSADPVLRQALVEKALRIDQQNPLPEAAAAAAGTAAVQPSPTTPGAGGKPPLFPSLSEKDRENLQTLASFDLIEIPSTVDAWLKSWQEGKWELKLLGIILTAMLLSLGAPFWYNALKNLIRLRSLIAQKDDDQRLTRQTNASPSSNLVVAAATTPAAPV